MPSPFPGMDPYLEDADLWPDVHVKFISEMQTALNPVLLPRYVARMEMRVYIAEEDDPEKRERIPDVRVEKRPRTGNGLRASSSTNLQVAEPIIVRLPWDEEVEETYLTIKKARSGQLVTVIEVLSPTNKTAGSPGRKSFLTKKREVYSSDVHWVEIDLLRTGQRLPGSPPLQSSDYRVLVSRGDDRGETRYWPISLRQRLPVIGIPLKDRAEEAPLDLGAVLSRAYDAAAYQATVEYDRPPEVPLAPADARWANQLLKSKGLR